MNIAFHQKLQFDGGVTSFFINTAIKLLFLVKRQLPTMPVCENHDCTVLYKTLYLINAGLDTVFVLFGRCCMLLFRLCNCDRVDSEDPDDRL